MHREKLIVEEDGDKRQKTVYRFRATGILTSLILCLGSSLSHCALLSRIKIPKPALELTGIKIREVTLTGIRFDILAQISNPYPVAFRTPGLVANVYLEEQQMTSIKAAPFALPASSRHVVPLDLKMSYRDLISFYHKYFGPEELAKREDFHLRLNGTLRASLGEVIPGVPESLVIDFDQTITIPAIVPEMTVRNFKLVDPGKNAVTLLKSVTGLASPQSAQLESEFEIVFSNRAGREVRFNELDLQFFAGNDEIFNGKEGSVRHENGRSILLMKTAIPLRNASRSLLNTVIRRSTPYRVTGHARFDVANFRSGELTLPFTKEGTLRW